MQAVTAWVYSEDRFGEGVRFSAPLLGWGEIRSLSLVPWKQYIFGKNVKNPPLGRLKFFDAPATSLSPKKRVYCNENTWYMKKVKGKRRRGKFRNKKRYAPHHHMLKATQEFVLPLENGFRFGVEILGKTNREDYKTTKKHTEDITNFVQTNHITTQQIRKHAYKLTGNIKSGRIAGRIKYIE